MKFWDEIRHLMRGHDWVEVLPRVEHFNTIECATCGVQVTFRRPEGR